MCNHKGNANSKERRKVITKAHIVSSITLLHYSQELQEVTLRNVATVVTGLLVFSAEMADQLLAAGVLDFALEKAGCVHVVKLNDGGHCDELHDDVHEIVERSEEHNDHNFDNDGDCALAEAQNKRRDHVPILHGAVSLLDSFEAMWVKNSVLHQLNAITGVRLDGQVHHESRQESRHDNEERVGCDDVEGVGVEHLLDDEGHHGGLDEDDEESAHVDVGGFTVVELEVAEEARPALIR